MEISIALDNYKILTSGTVFLSYESLKFKLDTLNFEISFEYSKKRQASLENHIVNDNTMKIIIKLHKDSTINIKYYPLATVLDKEIFLSLSIEGNYINKEKLVNYILFEKN